MYNKKNGFQPPVHRRFCMDNGITFERLAREAMLVAAEDGHLGQVVQHAKSKRKIEVSMFSVYNRVCNATGRTELDPIIDKAKMRLIGRKILRAID